MRRRATVTRNCYESFYFSASDQSALELSTNALFKDLKLCITRLRGYGVIKAVIANVINKIMNKSVNTIKFEAY